MCPCDAHAVLGRATSSIALCWPWFLAFELSSETRCNIEALKQSVGPCRLPMSKAAAAAAAQMLSGLTTCCRAHITIRHIGAVRRRDD